MVNPMAAAMVDLTPDEIIGRTPAEIVPGAASEGNPVLDRVYRTGEPEVLPNLSLPLPDGRVVPVYVVYAPVPDADGKPIGVVHLALDLTAREEAARIASLPPQGND